MRTLNKQPKETESAVVRQVHNEFTSSDDSTDDHKLAPRDSTDDYKLSPADFSFVLAGDPPPPPFYHGRYGQFLIDPWLTDDEEEPPIFGAVRQITAVV